MSGAESYTKVLREIAAFNVGAFPFALLGLGLGWVYLELGAAVVPLLVVNPRNPAVVALPLGGRLPPRVLGLVRHRDRYRSDASQAFVELAAELGADFMRRIQ